MAEKTYSEKTMSRSIDPAAREMLARAEELGIETAWDRLELSLIHISEPTRPY